MPITVGYTPAKLAGDLAAVSGRNRGALLYEQVKSGRIRDSIAKENLKLAKRGQRAQEDEADRRNELAQQELDQRRRDAGIRNAMGVLEMTNRENALTRATEIQEAQAARGADLAEDKFTYKQEQDKFTREAGEAAVKEEAIRYGYERAYGEKQDRIATGQAQQTINLRKNAADVLAEQKRAEELARPVDKQTPYQDADSVVKELSSQITAATTDLKHYSVKNPAFASDPTLPEWLPAGGDLGDLYEPTQRRIANLITERHAAERARTDVRVDLQAQRAQTQQQSQQQSQLANPQVRAQLAREIASQLISNSTVSRYRGMDEHQRDERAYKQIEYKGYDLEDTNTQALAIETANFIRWHFGDPMLPTQP